jgi:hypothetical protein
MASSIIKTKQGTFSHSKKLFTQKSSIFLYHIIPDGKLVVEFVAGARLFHVCVETHEGGGEELLTDGVGHDPDRQRINISEG